MLRNSHDRGARGLGPSCPALKNKLYVVFFSQRAPAPTTSASPARSGLFVQNIYNAFSGASSPGFGNENALSRVWVGVCCVPLPARELYDRAEWSCSRGVIFSVLLLYLSLLPSLSLSFSFSFLLFLTLSLSLSYLSTYAHSLSPISYFFPVFCPSIYTSVGCEPIQGRHKENVCRRWQRCE